MCRCFSPSTVLKPLAKAAQVGTVTNCDDCQESSRVKVLSGFGEGLQRVKGQEPKFSVCELWFDLVRYGSSSRRLEALKPGTHGDTLPPKLRISHDITESSGTFGSHQELGYCEVMWVAPLNWRWSRRWHGSMVSSEQRFDSLDWFHVEIFSLWGVFYVFFLIENIRFLACCSVVLWIYVERARQWTPMNPTQWNAQ